jgi:hypothetical protein
VPPGASGRDKTLPQSYPTTHLYSGNSEPTIDELLSDDIATFLRRRDGLHVTDVIRAIEQAKKRLALQSGNAQRS